WSDEQFSKSAQGKNIKVNLYPMNPWDSQKAIMESDKRLHIFAPASGLYKDGLIKQYKEKFSGEPMEPEVNVALTPLAYIFFQDHYDAFIGKYKELNFKTLNAAARAKGWEEIAGKPEWGPFTFTCSNPTEFNNGLAALTLMAYDFSNKYNGLNVDDIKAPAFQAWG